MLKKIMIAKQGRPPILDNPQIVRAQLEAEQVEALEQLRSEQKRSISELIRQAVDEFLAKRALTQPSPKGRGESGGKRAEAS